MFKSGPGRASSPTSRGRRTCFLPPSPLAMVEQRNGRALGPRRSASSRWARRSGRGQSHAEGEIKLISYQGAVTRFSVASGDVRISAEVPATETSFEPGDKVRLIWPKSAMVTMEDGA